MDDVLAKTHHHAGPRLLDRRATLEAIPGREVPRQRTPAHDALADARAMAALETARSRFLRDRAALHRAAARYERSLELLREVIGHDD